MGRLKLHELRAKNLARFAVDLALLGTRYPALLALTDEQRASVVAYFQNFVQPQGDHECVGCGDRIAFEWGIAHGQGFCGRNGCGYPTRGFHYPPDMGIDGLELPYGGIQAVLQWHPDELRTRDEVSAEAVKA